jgi:hypothetical protein
MAEGTERHEKAETLRYELRPPFPRHTGFIITDVLAPEAFGPDRSF